MNTETKGAILVFSSVIIFGIVGTLIRIINLPENIIIGISASIASIILSFVLIYRREFVFHKIGLLIFSGLLTIATIYFFFKAFSLTTMANTIFTHYTAPVFTALIAPFILKEKIGRKSILSLALSVVGLFLITSGSLSFEKNHLAGIMFGILSGFFYGILIVVNKILLEKNSPFQVMYAQSIVPAIILLPTVLFSDFRLSIISASLIIFQSILVYITASILYLYGMKYLDSHKSAIISYGEVIFTLLYAFIFFSEIPNTITIIGGAFIIIGGVLVMAK